MSRIRRSSINAEPRPLPPPMKTPSFLCLLPPPSPVRSLARCAGRTLVPALLTLVIAAPAALAASPAPAAPAAAPAVAIRGDTVYPVSGSAIKDGLVLIRDGRIAYVGPAAGQSYGAEVRELRAAVVVPGLVDARATVGVSGMLNQPHDQEQVDRSAPLQPELRAVDAYNARDELVAYIRARGVTTVHTGHGPGVPISGQTLVVKTKGRTAEADVLRPAAMIAATLGADATTTDRGKSPGTPAKAVALLRTELIKAKEYADKRAKLPEDKRPPRDLRLEALGRALDGSQPLLISVDRGRDILAALRVAREFDLKIVLEGCAEAPLVLEEIKASGFPVVLHPTMERSFGARENLSMETAAVLRGAGVPFAIQSGFEDYVPKTRIVLYEAAVAAGQGLDRDAALAAITLDAARIIGVADRIGSLEVGKDGDVALYDGDPLEYVTRCVGVVIDGVVFPGE
jgi:imidazolonepropionase-like amidohydrolase